MSQTDIRHLGNATS